MSVAPFLLGGWRDGVSCIRTETCVGMSRSHMYPKLQACIPIPTIHPFKFSQQYKKPSAAADGFKIILLRIRHRIGFVHRLQCKQADCRVYSSQVNPC